MITRGSLWPVGVLVLAALQFGVTAAAQDTAVLSELKEWHDKIVQPGVVISVELGQEARARLQNWGLTAGSLAPEQRGRLVRLEICSALAVGDGAAALKALSELEMDFPWTRETLEATYATALATGDAQRAAAALEKLKEQPDADTRLLSARTRQLSLIGTAAPDLKVQAENGPEIALRGRDGVVLVVDLWRVAQQPSAAEAKALAALFEPHRADLNVQFLGINSDGPAKVAEAKQFAADNGYIWPQHYEQRSAAPVTNRDFRAGSPPWTVIIDGAGNVRAVGAATEPALHYALRAAVAEVRGEHAALRPKTTTGREAPGVLKPADTPAAPKKDAAGGTGEPQPGPDGEAQPGGKKSGGGDAGPAKPKGELPSNPEAKALLDRARLYIKTGRKTDARKLLHEIVEKYPGTREAAEAEEMLRFV